MDGGRVRRPRGCVSGWENERASERLLDAGLRVRVVVFDVAAYRGKGEAAREGGSTITNSLEVAEVGMPLEATDTVSSTADKRNHSEPVVLFRSDVSSAA